MISNNPSVSFALLCSWCIHDVGLGWTQESDRSSCANNENGKLEKELCLLAHLATVTNPVGKCGCSQTI